MLRIQGVPASVLVGRFLSIDPVAADPGTGGNFNRYWYANNNPYRFTDPDGRIFETVFDGISLAVGVSSFVSNVSEGSLGAAALDAVGIVVDAAAFATPFVPGGAGIAIKAGRGAEKVANAAKVAKTESGKRVGDFTKAQKDAAKAQSAAENGGKMACADCGKTVENVASQKGVSTPDNQAQVHHDPALKDGGSQDSEPVVLCPTCHQERHQNN